MEQLRPEVARARWGTCAVVGCERVRAKRSRLCQHHKDGARVARRGAVCAGGCGKRLHRGTGSLPPGKRTCQDCRRRKREGRS